MLCVKVREWVCVARQPCGSLDELELSLLPLQDDKHGHDRIGILQYVQITDHSFEDDTVGPLLHTRAVFFPIPPAAFMHSSVGRGVHTLRHTNIHVEETDSNQKEIPRGK